MSSRERQLSPNTLFDFGFEAFRFFVFPDVTFILYLCITSDPLLNGILHQVTSIKDKFTLYVAIFGGILGT